MENRDIETPDKITDVSCSLFHSIKNLSDTKKFSAEVKTNNKSSLRNNSNLVAIPNINQLNNKISNSILLAKLDQAKELPKRRRGVAGPIIKKITKVREDTTICPLYLKTKTKELIPPKLLKREEYINWAKQMKRLEIYTEYNPRSFEELEISKSVEITRNNLPSIEINGYLDIGVTLWIDLRLLEELQRTCTGEDPTEQNLSSIYNKAKYRNLKKSSSTIDSNVTKFSSSQRAGLVFACESININYTLYQRKEKPVALNLQNYMNTNSDYQSINNHSSTKKSSQLNKYIYSKNQKIKKCSNSYFLNYFYPSKFYHDIKFSRYSSTIKRLNDNLNLSPNIFKILNYTYSVQLCKYFFIFFEVFYKSSFNKDIFSLISYNVIKNKKLSENCRTPTKLILKQNKKIFNIITYIKKKLNSLVNLDIRWKYTINSPNIQYVKLKLVQNKQNGVQSIGLNYYLSYTSYLKSINFMTDFNSLRYSVHKSFRSGFKDVNICFKVDKYWSIFFKTFMEFIYTLVKLKNRNTSFNYKKLSASLLKTRITKLTFFIDEQNKKDIITNREFSDFVERFSIINRIFHEDISFSLNLFLNPKKKKIFKSNRSIPVFPCNKKVQKLNNLNKSKLNFIPFKMTTYIKLSQYRRVYKKLNPKIDLCKIFNRQNNNQIYTNSFIFASDRDQSRKSIFANNALLPQSKFNNKPKQNIKRPEHPFPSTIPLQFRSGIVNYLQNQNTFLSCNNNDICTNNKLLDFTFDDVDDLFATAAPQQKNILTKNNSQVLETYSQQNLHQRDIDYLNKRKSNEIDHPKDESSFFKNKKDLFEFSKKTLSFKDNIKDYNNSIEKRGSLTSDIKVILADFQAPRTEVLLECQQMYERNLKGGLSPQLHSKIQLNKDVAELSKYKSNLDKKILVPFMSHNKNLSGNINTICDIVENNIYDLSKKENINNFKIQKLISKNTPQNSCAESSTNKAYIFKSHNIIHQSSKENDNTDYIKDCVKKEFDSNDELTNTSNVFKSNNDNEIYCNLLEKNILDNCKYISDGIDKVIEDSVKPLSPKSAIEIRDYFNQIKNSSEPSYNVLKEAYYDESNLYENSFSKIINNENRLELDESLIATDEEKINEYMEYKISEKNIISHIPEMNYNSIPKKHDFFNYKKSHSVENTRDQTSEDSNKKNSNSESKCFNKDIVTETNSKPLKRDYNFHSLELSSGLVANKNQEISTISVYKNTDNQLGLDCKHSYNNPLISTKISDELCGINFKKTSSLHIPLNHEEISEVNNCEILNDYNIVEKRNEENIDEKRNEENILAKEIFLFNSFNTETKYLETKNTLNINNNYTETYPKLNINSDIKQNLKISEKKLYTEKDSFHISTSNNCNGSFQTIPIEPPLITQESSKINDSYKYIESFDSKHKQKISNSIKSHDSLCLKRKNVTDEKGINKLSHNWDLFISSDETENELKVKKNSSSTIDSINPSHFEILLLESFGITTKEHNPYPLSVDNKDKIFNRKGENSKRFLCEIKYNNRLIKDKMLCRLYLSRMMSISFLIVLLSHDKSSSTKIKLSKLYSNYYNKDHNTKCFHNKILKIAQFNIKIKKKLYSNKFFKNLGVEKSTNQFNLRNIKCVTRSVQSIENTTKHCVPNCFTKKSETLEKNVNYSKQNKLPYEYSILYDTNMQINSKQSSTFQKKKCISNSLVKNLELDTNLDCESLDLSSNNELKCRNYKSNFSQSLRDSYISSKLESEKLITTQYDYNKKLSNISCTKPYQALQEIMSDNESDSMEYKKDLTSSKQKDKYDSYINRYDCVKAFYTSKSCISEISKPEIALKASHSKVRKDSHISSDDSLSKYIITELTKEDKSHPVYVKKNSKQINNIAQSDTFNYLDCLTKTTKNEVQLSQDRELENRYKKVEPSDSNKKFIMRDESSKLQISFSSDIQRSSLKSDTASESSTNSLTKIIIDAFTNEKNSTSLNNNQNSNIFDESSTNRHSLDNLVISKDTSNDSLSINFNRTLTDKESETDYNFDISNEETILTNHNRELTSIDIISNSDLSDNSEVVSLSQAIEYAFSLNNIINISNQEKIDDGLLSKESKKEAIIFKDLNYNQSNNISYIDNQKNYQSKLLSTSTITENLNKNTNTKDLKDTGKLKIGHYVTSLYNRNKSKYIKKALSILISLNNLYFSCIDLKLILSKVKRKKILIINNIQCKDMLEEIKKKKLIKTKPKYKALTGYINTKRKMKIRNFLETLGLWKQGKTYFNKIVSVPKPNEINNEIFDIYRTIDSNIITLDKKNTLKSYENVSDDINNISNITNEKKYLDSITEDNFNNTRITTNIDHRIKSEVHNIYKDQVMSSDRDCEYLYNTTVKQPDRNILKLPKYDKNPDDICPKILESDVSFKSVHKFNQEYTLSKNTGVVQNDINNSSISTSRLLQNQNEKIECPIIKTNSNQYILGDHLCINTLQSEFNSIDKDSIHHIFLQDNENKKSSNSSSSVNSNYQAVTDQINEILITKTKESQNPINTTSVEKKFPFSNHQDEPIDNSNYEPLSLLPQNRLNEEMLLHSEFQNSVNSEIIDYSSILSDSTGILNKNDSLIEKFKYKNILVNPNFNKIRNIEFINDESTNFTNMNLRNHSKFNIPSSINLDTQKLDEAYKINNFNFIPSIYKLVDETEFDRNDNNLENPSKLVENDISKLDQNNNGNTTIDSLLKLTDFSIKDSLTLNKQKKKSLFVLAKTKDNSEEYDKNIDSQNIQKSEINSICRELTCDEVNLTKDKDDSTSNDLLKNIQTPVLEIPNILIDHDLVTLQDNKISKYRESSIKSDSAIILEEIKNYQLSNLTEQLTKSDISVGNEKSEILSKDFESSQETNNITSSESNLKLDKLKLDTNINLDKLSFNGSYKTQVTDACLNNNDHSKRQTILMSLNDSKQIYDKNIESIVSRDMKCFQNNTTSKYQLENKNTRQKNISTGLILQSYKQNSYIREHKISVNLLEKNIKIFNEDKITNQYKESSRINNITNLQKYPYEKAQIIDRESGILSVKTDSGFIYPLTIFEANRVCIINEDDINSPTENITNFSESNNASNKVLIPWKDIVGAL